MATVTEASLKGKAMVVLVEALGSDVPQKQIDTALDILGILREREEGKPFPVSREELAVLYRFGLAEEADGVPPLTEDEWDALTDAEKTAYRRELAGITSEEVAAAVAIHAADGRMRAMMQRLQDLADDLTDKIQSNMVAPSDADVDYARGAKFAYAHALSVVQGALYEINALCADKEDKPDE